MQIDHRMIPMLLALTGMVMAVFALWPGIDLAVSAWFFDNGAFPVRQKPLIEALRRGLWDLSIIIPVLALAFLGASLFNKGRAMGAPTRIWAFVLALFVLGPGLLVNVVLKSHWGRARPTQVIDFGGTADFTPFYEISNQCARNCSFVSGEGSGSMAMAITALVILHGLRTRLSPWLYSLGQGLTLLMLGFVGVQRVASGGHFLSDVMLSWAFTALIAAVLARFLLSKDIDDPTMPVSSAP